MQPLPDVIRNRAGERIDYTHHPGATIDAPIVVIGHGVTAHKDRPFLIALAEGLSRAGIAALRISFSGNGESEGRFADSNVTKGVSDLASVLDALPHRALAFAGHSMGGAVGAISASRDSRIQYLVSLSAIVHTRAFAQRAFGHLTPGSGLMFDKPGCVLSQAYLDDLVSIDSVLDRADEIEVPWLFVHGVRDALVPISDTRDIYAHVRGPKKLVVLDEADHVYEPGLTQQMVEAVTEWCQEQFSR